MSVKAVNLSPLEQKTQVLLVEDDDDFRRSLTIRLTKRGYEVLPAASAEEAMSLLKTKEVDAVVADIKLGEVDGIDLLSMIREEKDNLPVILVTGYASLDSAREAVRLEANDYLLKPLENIEELLNPLEKAVQSHRLNQENQKLKSQLTEMLDAVETTEKKYKNLRKKVKELEDKTKD